MRSRPPSVSATLKSPWSNMVRRHSCVVLVLAGVCGTAVAAPRAEVQMAVCVPLVTLTRKLALIPREAAYGTWQFDDGRLGLLERNVRIRLRVRKGGGELTVKIATPDCAAVRVPKHDGKCEYDVYGGKPQSALSLTRKLDAAVTRDLAAGRSAVASALGATQAQYLRAVPGAWPLPADLRPLGPIANGVYVDARGNDVDVSTLPDGTRYVEIGIKVPLADATAAQQALEARLTEAGVTVCTDQRGQAADKLRRLAAP